MIYARGISYPPFIFDDGVQIFNSAFMKGSPWYFITHSLTPIPYLVWRLISFLFGTEQTYFFHLSNILIHAFNGFLVWKISKFIFSQRDHSHLLSYLVASIFILHPVQVESVIWISGLRTVLGGTFGLISLYYFLLYMNREDGVRDLSSLIISYVFIFLIVFTYPPMISVALTFPFFLLLLGKNLNEIMLLRKDRNFIVMSAVQLSFLGLTFFLHESNVLSKSFAILSFNAYLQLILSTLGQYIINTLMPLKLYFDYQINPLTLNYLKEDFQFNHAFYVGIIGALTSASLFIAKKTRVMGFTLLCYLLFLLPNLGIIHHDFHNISSVADRYLYLSIFPYALLLIMTVLKIEHSLKKISIFNSISLSLITLLCFALLSIHQVGLWGNQKEFLARSTPKAQLSIPLLLSLGNLYKDEGQYNKATSYYQEILTSDPNNKSAFDALIDIFFKNPSISSAERVTFLVTKKTITPIEDDLFSIAKIFYFLKEFDQALSYAKKSLYLGISAKKATEIIELAGKHKKEEVRAHLDRLFSLYYSTDQFEMAQQLNDELLRLYPQNSYYIEMKNLITQEFKN